MMTFSDQFLKALAQGYRNYIAHGARSNAKLIPVHKCIARHVKQMLGGTYAVKSLGIGDGKEHTVAGRYHNKTTDITVLNKASGKPVCAICFKYVISNYTQNSVNYFEGMMGETANLRRAGCGVAQVTVLRREMPYKRKDGTTRKIEHVSDHNLRKYIRLQQDIDNPHKPDLLHIILVDMDEAKKRVTYSTPATLPFDDDLKALLAGELSLAAFTEKLPHLCELKK